MKLLITGSAGFVGSVTSVIAMERGHEVVGIDDFSAGTHEVKGIKSIRRDVNVMHEVDRQATAVQDVDVVLHLSAMHFIEQCEKDPLGTFTANAAATAALIKWCELRNKPMVFASTAAVYGNPEKTPITEDAKIAPVGCYGDTKVWCEKLLGWSKIDWTALRFFNVVGAYGGFGERPGVEHILPTIFRLAKQEGSVFRVNGVDYPTRDGTCVRDYVNVKDIAMGLLLTAEQRHFKRDVINLGTRSGHTVLEVLNVANEFLTSHGLQRLPYADGPRRQGDPVELVCDYARAKELIGWEPSVSFEESVAQTWETFTRNNA